MPAQARGECGVVCAVQRWNGILSVAAQRVFATSSLEQPLRGAAAPSPSCMRSLRIRVAPLLLPRRARPGQTHLAGLACAGDRGWGQTAGKSARVKKKDSDMYEIWDYAGQQPKSSPIYYIPMTHEFVFAEVFGGAFARSQPASHCDPRSPPEADRMSYGS